MRFLSGEGESEKKKAATAASQSKIGRRRVTSGEHREVILPRFAFSRHIFGGMSAVRPESEVGLHLAICFLVVL